MYEKNLNCLFLSLLAFSVFSQESISILNSGSSQKDKVISASSLKELEWNLGLLEKNYLLQKHYLSDLKTELTTAKDSLTQLEATLGKQSKLLGT